MKIQSKSIPEPAFSIDKETKEFISDMNNRRREELLYWQSSAQFWKESYLSLRAEMDLMDGKGDK